MDRGDIVDGQRKRKASQISLLDQIESGDDSAEGPPIDVNTTSTLYNAFKNVYGLDIDQKRFTGLCAYLSAVLCKGYRIHVNHLDSFICEYPRYQAGLPLLESQHGQMPNEGIVSYHSWLARHRRDGEQLLMEGKAPLLTEEKLRAIWQENPYTFLLAQTTLDYLLTAPKI